VKYLPVFAKITRIVFSGLRSTNRLSLHIGLSACITSDDRRHGGALYRVMLSIR